MLDLDDGVLAGNLNRFPGPVIEDSPGERGHVGDRAAGRIGLILPQNPPSASATRRLSRSCSRRLAASAAAASNAARPLVSGQRHMVVACASFAKGDEPPLGLIP